MAKLSIFGEGTPELLDKFLESWNSSKGEMKEIYIDSEGGQYSVFVIMLDIINSAPSKCELIACGELHSSAFELFFLAKCKKRILPMTFGMYHQSFYKIETDERGKPKSDMDKARLDNLKISQKYTLNFCKSIGMNASEIKRIRDGEDVYFQIDRLNYFLKVSESGK